MSDTPEITLEEVPEVDEPGKHAEPAGGEPPPIDGAGEPGPAPEVTPAQIAGYLDTAGAMANNLAGRTPEHWVLTDSELEIIAPVLADYVNRHAALRAYVAHAEPAAAGLVLIQYAIRNAMVEAAYRSEQKKPPVETAAAATEPPPPGENVSDEWAQG